MKTSGQTPPTGAIGLGFFSFFCLAALALFIWLGYYAFPIADDHSYGAQYAATPFAEMQVYLYMHHSGRYVSNIFYGPLGALSGNLTLYHAYAFIHIALLVFALRCLVGAVHKGSKAAAWAMTLALSASFVAGLPSPSQGIYWMCGAVTYFVAFNAFFGLLACVSCRIWAPERWKRPFTAILAVCLLVSMGSNEITAVATVFFATCAFAMAHLCRHPARRFLGCLLAASLALLCVVVGAPGNFTRAAGERAWDWGFLLPVAGGAFEGYKWFFRPPLIPSLLICALLLKPRWNFHIRPFSRKALFIGIPLAACALFFGEFLFVYLASGRAPYARINNAIYHSAFTVGLFATALLFPDIQAFFKKTAEKWGARALWPGLAVLFFVFVLAQPNTWFGIRNTANGEFAQYREIWLQRLALIPPKGTAKDRIIDMPAQKTRPFPIVFRDLKEEQEKHQWIAPVFAQFHGIGGVRVVSGEHPDGSR